MLKYKLILIIYIIAFLACSKKDSILPLNSLSNELTIGQYYQGGKIIKIYSLGDSEYRPGETHGIIVGLKEYESIWGTYVTLSNGNEHYLRIVDSCYDIKGNGRINTTIIVNNLSKIYLQDPLTNKLILGNISKQTIYAAKICDTLNLNGYNDWYLPTSEELYLASQPNSGANLSGEYWTSVSVIPRDNNGRLYFDFGPETYVTSAPGFKKTYQSDSREVHKIRPIRYF